MLLTLIFNKHANVCEIVQTKLNIIDFSKKIFVFAIHMIEIECYSETKPVVRYKYYYYVAPLIVIAIYTRISGVINQALCVLLLPPGVYMNSGVNGMHSREVLWRIDCPFLAFLFPSQQQNTFTIII